MTEYLNKNYFMNAHNGQQNPNLRRKKRERERPQEAAGKTAIKTVHKRPQES